MAVSEFWLIVTLCAVPSLTGAPYGAERSLSSSDCAEFRVDGSFPSIDACRLHQATLRHLPWDRRQLIASLCTATLDEARLGKLPLLSTELGSPA
jgi:hypothetical protein